MAASSTTLFFQSPLSCNFIPKSIHLSSHKYSSSSFPSPSSLCLHLSAISPTTQSSPRRFHNLLNPHDVNLPLLRRRTKVTKKWKLYSSVHHHEQFWLSEAANSVEGPQEIVPSSSSDDGVSIFISALLFAAFVGLSVLTIGAIYLGVTDFLQKREGEKFEKEEAAKKKKFGKKTKVRARSRSGPRGFGQKIEDDDDDQAAD